MPVSLLVSWCTTWNPSDDCSCDSPFSGGSPPRSQMCEFPILNKDSLACVVDMPLRAISPPWLPAGPPSLWCPASCSTYRTRRSLETTRRQITWVHSSRRRVVGGGGLRASRSGLENFMQRRKWKAWATRRGIARRRSRRRLRIQRIQRILVSYSIMGSRSAIVSLMHLHNNLRRCGTWTNNLTILMGRSPPSHSNAVIGWAGASALSIAPDANNVSLFSGIFVLTDSFFVLKIFPGTL